MSLVDWTEGGAEFDYAYRDGAKPTYRHHLWRARPTDLLNDSRRKLGVCMHNPSIAGSDPARENDPTIRKLIGFAERWGFARIDVVNLGDLIATDPKEFYAAYPGRRESWLCDARIREVSDRCDVMLVAWGRLRDNWGRARARDVLALINRPVVCIRKGNGGHPLHPLMEAYTDAPLPYEVRP
jgi:hypothetical protein